MQVLCFVLLALVSVSLSQQQSSCSCSSGCRPPYSGASCVNGVWEYSGNLGFDGTVNIRCPIRVTGDVSVRAGTTLNFVPCARIEVARNFLANDGVGVTLDLQNTDPTVGLRYRFLTYGGTASGYISNVGLSNLGGTGRSPSLIGRLRNGEGSIGFGNPDLPSDLSSENGDVNTPRPIPGTSSNIPSGSPSGSPFDAPVSTANSDFDANGDRINKCNTYTCTNPNICNQITDDATCDASTGEWVIPTDLYMDSGTISCPVRIQGAFGANGPLKIGACAKINVQGRTTLRRGTGNGVASWIPLTFDLNDFGRPRVGDRIRWLQSSGGITGNFAGVGAENIWDLTGTVDIANQICGNDVTLHFYAAGQTAPASNCNPSASTTRTRAETDELANDESLDALFENEALGFNDAAVADSDTPANTPTTTTSSSSAPGYAYALFAIAVFILIALVVLQVQIVLVGRAKEAARH